MTDDDIMLDDKESIEKMFDVLTSEDNMGLVSGMIHLENGQYLSGENYQKGLRFEVKDKVLYRHPSTKEYHKTKKGAMYIVADQVVNFFLAKKKLFNDVMWDERIKIEWEHQDFFYQMLKTNWKASVCLGTRAIHQTHIPNSEYNQHRRNAPAVYFLQKHGIVAAINRF